MADEITTKPAESQQQWKWMFATDQPFARRWAHETPGGKGKRFSNLPKRVKRKALKAAPCMDCVLASLKGEQIAPGITRIRGNLCNVHGRYGPCDAAQGGKKKPAKGRKPRAPVKPKQTPEQRAAATQAQHATNRAAVDKQLGFPEDAAGALDDLRAGKAVDDDGGLVKLGLAEQAADGSYRLTPSGRALAAARDAGDAGRARDIMSSAKDRAAANRERDTARQARQAGQTGSKRGIQDAMSQIGQGKPPTGGTGAGGGGAKKKPAAQTQTQTPEQRREEHRASVRQTMAASDTGLAPAGFDNLVGLFDGKEPDAQGSQSLIDLGLAERGGDGTLRLTGSGRVAVNAANRGDTKAAVDAISRGKDQHSAQQQRGADRAKRDAERQAREAARQTQRVQPPPQPVARSRGAPIQTRGTANRGTRRTPRKRTPVSQGGPRRMPQTTKAADPGDYLVVEDRTKPSTWHLQVKRNGTPDHGLMGAAWAALHSGFRGNTYQGPNKQQALSKLRALYASEKMPLPSEKSFTVFKDTAGQWRWIARTTTAFEDRDSEVISTKALDESAASAAPRGPLRWWHMGRPDVTDSAQPWGAGVDLGWCDFAAVSGRTLIESGTFKSEPIARAVAAHQSDLELSPGFFHAAGEPDTSGVFHHIRIFERSLVPKWAGRASNPYTGLIVEKTMDQKKIQALKDLGASDDVITALLADVQQTEKSAEADGVRYKDTPLRDLFVRLLKGEQVTTKEEAASVVEETVPPPDPIAELMATVKALQEEVATLKQPMPASNASGMGGMMDAEDDPSMGGDMGMDEAAEGEPPMDGSGDGGLTLSADDLSAIGQVIGQVLSSAMEPLIGALGITQKLDGHLSELKTMMSGYTKTKDDAQAALVSKVDQVEAKVAELSGDLPRQGYRASQSPENTVQALVTAATLKDGAAPTDDSPFADLVQHLFGQQR